MTNSAQEYIDKLYNQSQGVAGQLHEQRKKSDDEVIQQINAAIDRATASSTNPYKAQMEQLPSQYQPLLTQMPCRSWWGGGRCRRRWRTWG